MMKKDEKSEKKKTPQLAEIEICRRDQILLNNAHLVDLGLPPDGPLCKESVALLKSQGRTIHIPAEAFPDDEPPPSGYWVGKTVKTRALGGSKDVAIFIASTGERFSRPVHEVLNWTKMETTIVDGHVFKAIDID